jgi:hypothetical protein
VADGGSPPWWRPFLGVAALGVIVPYTAVFTAAFLIVIRILEWKEPDEEAPPPDRDTRGRILEGEDIALVNQLTLLAPCATRG